MAVDSNLILEEIRKLANAVLRGRGAGDRVVAMGGVTLALRFSALDKLLRTGGSLPKDWQTAIADDVVNNR